MMKSNFIISQQECNTNHIYSNYKNIISELIAYIEVYEHDLPAEIMAQIAELFQTVALYETEIGLNKNVNGMSCLSKTNLKITQSLYKHAICLFIRRIEEYKKVFKHFKYKGVMWDNENFVSLAKTAENDIIKAFSKKLKICYEKNLFETLATLSVKDSLLYLIGYIKISVLPSFSALKKEPYLPIDNLIVEQMNDADLKDTYEFAKDLLQKYETVLPRVIKNGAEKSLFSSIFIAFASWIIPVALVIPTLIKIINVIQVFVCK